MDQGTCKHEICDCPATGDNEYCSDHCREAVAQDITELNCDCGHPGCE